MSAVVLYMCSWVDSVWAALSCYVISIYDSHPTYSYMIAYPICMCVCESRRQEADQFISSDLGSTATYTANGFYLFISRFVVFYDQTRF